MKLTSQVCTFEQAKKLFELGIAYESLFYINLNNEIIPNDGENCHDVKYGPYHAAFTVAELCAMLLCDANEKSGWNIYWKKGKFQIIY